MRDYISEHIDLPEYIKEKIRMLRRDFKIRLTNAEIAHFKSLKSDIAVDQYAHKILTSRL